MPPYRQVADRLRNKKGRSVLLTSCADITLDKQPPLFHSLPISKQVPINIYYNLSTFEELLCLIDGKPEHVEIVFLKSIYGRCL